MKSLFLVSLVTFSALSGCCTTAAKVPVNEEEQVDRLEVHEPRLGLQN